MTQNTQAISIADVKAMLVTPTIPAAILETEAKKLMAFVGEHELNPEKAEIVAYLRMNHGAQLATVGRYLCAGADLDRIALAYAARDGLDEMATCKGKPSIRSLIEAADYFADSEDSEYFQELLLELPSVYPNLEYNDTIVKVALNDAQERGILYLGDLIDRRR